MNPQANKELLETALTAVKGHCMCFSFEETEVHYIVLFPAGDFALNGVRVSKGMGKIVALNKAFQVMEKTWVDSAPGAR